MTLKSFLHPALAFTLFAQSLLAPHALAQGAQTQAAPPQPTQTQAQPSAQDDVASRVAALAKAFDEKRAEAGVPGASLVVVAGDRVILLKGSGLRDAAKNLPATPDTLFAIGSCTKAFTALAAVISQDDGKLSLDDSPKKYLPYFRLRDPEADSQATIRDLLSHRTGLAGTDIAWYTGVLSREEVIRAAGRAKPTARLREKFQYQNVMYSAAGETVARAQGTTWENLVASRILKPLGMTKTVLSVREMQAAPDYSLGYEYDAKKKQSRQVPTRDLTNIAPAGAINSSAREMAEWLKFLVAGGVAAGGRRLVSERGFAEILTPQIKTNETTAYTLGWGTTTALGHKIYSHNGGIDGFGAQVSFLPDDRIGWAVLANVEDTPLLAQMPRLVITTLLGAPAQTPNAATATGATTATTNASAATTNTSAAAGDALKELIGTYEMAMAGVRVEVKQKDERVVLSVAGQPDYTLVEKGKDTFALLNVPDAYGLSAKRDAAGKITSIVIRQPEGETEMTRVADKSAAAATTNTTTGAASGGAGTPSASAPISADELLAKMIAAAGGEANLRRHKTMIVRAAVTFDNQGLDGESVTYAQAPDSFAREVTFTGFGKRLGMTREFFDGAQGGEETSFVARGEAWGARKLAESRTVGDFYELLDRKSLYKTIEVRGTEKVNGEDAYVVRLTPNEGAPATEYVSTKTFLLLRRDALESDAAGMTAAPVKTYFSDYRPVEGVLVPFSISYTVPGTGETTLRVSEVRFGAAIPAEAFRAKKPTQ